MATDAEEKIMFASTVAGAVVGLIVIVGGEYALFTGLPSGRYPILIFALPLLGGAVVAFLVAMLPLPLILISDKFKKGR
jgi:hypothetical protein